MTNVNFLKVNFQFSYISIIRHLHNYFLVPGSGRWWGYEMDTILILQYGGRVDDMDTILHLKYTISLS